MPIGTIGAGPIVADPMVVVENWLSLGEADRETCPLGKVLVIVKLPALEEIRTTSRAWADAKPGWCIWDDVADLATLVIKARVMAALADLPPEDVPDAVAEVAAADRSELGKMLAGRA